MDGFEGPLDDKHHRGTRSGWRKEGLPWEQTVARRADSAAMRFGPLCRCVPTTPHSRHATARRDRVVRATASRDAGGARARRHVRHGSPAGAARRARLQGAWRRSVGGDARALRGKARARNRLPRRCSARTSSQLNLPFRYGCRVHRGRRVPCDHRSAARRAALERIRAHLVRSGHAVHRLATCRRRAQRLAAPLVEVRTVRLDDGSQIALRSETTMDRRCARSCARSVASRIGAARAARRGERERVRGTGTSLRDILELVRAAGFRDARRRAVACRCADPDDRARRSRVGSRDALSSTLTSSPSFPPPPELPPPPENRRPTSCSPTTSSTGAAAGAHREAADRRRALVLQILLAPSRTSGVRLTISFAIGNPTT